MADTPSRPDDEPKIMLRPTPRQRILVSRPLGELLAGGSFPEVLRERFLSRGARVSFSVGDVVTSDLIRARIPFEVAVVDAHVERKVVEVPRWPSNKTFRVRNPRGHLSFEAREVMRRAASAGGGSLVIVDGEEDLLTLFAIDLSEEGDLVIYGQPDEGVVVVRIDAEAKRKNSRLLASIPRVRAESH